jgi:hypothetical protein
LSARFGVLVGAWSLVACAQIIGIGDFPGERGDASSDAQVKDVAASDGPPSYCQNGTVVIASSTELDAIASANGFVFAQAFSVGLERCAIGSLCVDPPPLLNVPLTDDFDYATIGSSIVYSTRNNTGGTVRRTAYDGTGDVAIYSGTASPSFVALGGGAAYWVDQALPAQVHCIGCSASDTVWIDDLQNPIALFADSNAVYVVAVDDSNVNFAIFGCGMNAACSTQPRTVIKSLPNGSVGPTSVASDGVNVYVPRTIDSSIVSVDTIGNVTKLVSGVQATALAVDAPSGELFYGTTTGVIGRVKTDGSSPSTVSSCQGPILALSFDANDVFALVTTNQGAEWVTFAIPR